MSRAMRPIKETIALEEAQQLIAGAMAPIDLIVVVALDQAHGRVLAEDVNSDQDVPPFSRAGMDGYAVVAEDTFGASRLEPRTLTVIETVYTGEVPIRRVNRGEAAEIATGAPMPDGADAVVMVEEAERTGTDQVRIFVPVYPRQHVGKQGADIARGQTVLERGAVLNPSRIGALAALGHPCVTVYARPTVAILSTGNEIVEPGTPLRPGQIYDINRYTLAAVIAEHGGTPLPRPSADDTIGDLDQALDAALEADVLVFSGGSSVGERDLMLDVIARRGEIVFHGVAVKPGKPTVFGVIHGKPIFGMPGYPTSCLSNAYMLLIPALRRMARLPSAQPRTVRLPLGQRIVSTTGRHQFYTMRVIDAVAHPAFKASGDITSMAHADGYIEIAAQTDIVDQGELVDVRLF